MRGGNWHTFQPAWLQVRTELFSSLALQKDVRNATQCKMGSAQILGGTLAATPFAELKLEVTARAFNNSGLKLSILAFKSFN